MGGNNLSEEQRYFIKFMKVYLQYTPKQIQHHPSILSSDGSVRRLSTIKYWLNRIDTTGNCEVKAKTGRPRLLNNEQEAHLIKTIKLNPKTRFRVIQDKSGLFIPVRTINNYSLRNKMRK